MLKFSVPGLRAADLHAVVGETGLVQVLRYLGRLPAARLPLDNQHLKPQDCYLSVR